MTENELRNKVVSTAKAWHGRKESNGSHKEIIDVYNSQRPLPRSYSVKYNDAWCATYVSAVAVKLGLTGIIFPECSCYYMVEHFKSAGRWVENDAHKPQPGDIVMYDWDDTGSGDNTGTPDHVGIVCSVSGNTMQIIEGNISNSVDYRTLAVNARYIRGYCCPDYASKADAKEPAETPTAAPAASTYAVKKGDTLWALAEKWLGSGLRYTEIMELNGLKSDALSIGQVLKIPGTISETETVTPATSEIKEGDTVRVNRGAKDYDGRTLIPIVYNRTHTVDEIRGDRVVLSVSGIVVGAFRKNDLTKA